MRATWILRLQESLKSPRSIVQLAKVPFEAKNKPRSTSGPPAETTSLALNNLPSTKNGLKLCGVQWTTAGRALMGHREGISSNSACFYMRAVPQAVLPMPEANPYGPPCRPPKEFTQFAVITTIKGISKRAVQRNRVRTRFKEAVRLVLTRDARATSGSGEISVPPANSSSEHRNAALLLEGYCYSAQLEPIVYSLPMPQLVEQVRRSLLDIQKKRSRKEAGLTSSKGKMSMRFKHKPQRASEAK